jgi:hypothetical protein
MTGKFIEIYDPKKRNEIVEENLRLRKKLKNRSEEQENTQNEIEQTRVELFKPIIESNQKLQNEMIEDRNKIINTLNSFNQLKIEEKQAEKQEVLAIEPKKSDNLVVSNLIANYLKDTTNRSNAGYSIRYNSEKDCYTIGNKVIEIEDNQLKIDDKIYNATNGLLELLLKKSPNLTLISEDDKHFYKQILDDSNAIYQGFNSNSKRLNANSSEIWKFIKNELLNSKSEEKIDNSNKALPSDPNELTKMLQQSITSYKSGKDKEIEPPDLKDEHNKIKAILDELVKIKKIKKEELEVIYENIGF